jgi:hypothetical protein
MPVRHEAHFEAIRGIATKARMDNNGNQQSLGHHPIRRNRIMTSSLCLSMIFSENRFPLFRIML